MNEWMDGWVDGWMDWRMDGWILQSINQSTNILVPEVLLFLSSLNIFVGAKRHVYRRRRQSENQTSISFSLGLRPRCTRSFATINTLAIIENNQTPGTRVINQSCNQSINQSIKQTNGRTNECYIYFCKCIK